MQLRCCLTLLFNTLSIWRWYHVFVCIHYGLLSRGFIYRVLSDIFILGELNMTSCHSLPLIEVFPYFHVIGNHVCCWFLFLCFLRKQMITSTESSSAFFWRPRTRSSSCLLLQQCPGRVSSTTATSARRWRQWAWAWTCPAETGRSASWRRCWESWWRPRPPTCWLRSCGAPAPRPTSGGGSPR